jgi:transcriptional regulator with XRE-family HTH domain
VGKQYKDQEYLIKVGLKLAEMRGQKKVSQEKLSELTQIDTRQIGRVERAETNASISLIKLFAEKLEVKLSDILDV